MARSQSVPRSAFRSSASNFGCDRPGLAVVIKIPSIRAARNGSVDLRQVGSDATAFGLAPVEATHEIADDCLHATMSGFYDQPGLAGGYPGRAPRGSRQAEPAGQRAGPVSHPCNGRTSILAGVRQMSEPVHISVLGQREVFFALRTF